MEKNDNVLDTENLVLTRLLNSISDIQEQVLEGDFLGAFISTWNLFSILPIDVRCEAKIKTEEKAMEKIQFTIKGFSPCYSNKNRAQILIDWTSKNIKTVLEDMNESLYERARRLHVNQNSV